MMGFKELMETNPVLLVQGAAAFAGVCTALGLRELLSKAIERYWHKADEKDTDHQRLEEMIVKIDEIIARLDDMDRKNEEFNTNDMLLIEDRLLWMQRKAIQNEKVSRRCMPRYNVLLKRYRELNERTDIPLNEEVMFNDEIIQSYISEGKIVATWEEANK